MYRKMMAALREPKEVGVMCKIYVVYLTNYIHF